MYFLNTIDSEVIVYDYNTVKFRLPSSGAPI